jgi:hypothetical protein
MNDPAGDSPAWAAFLPADIVWLPGQHRWAAARRLRRAVASHPEGTSVAVAASPWAVLRAREAGGRPAVLGYVAIPSRRDPLVVASQDGAALRYVATSVLSVPPGAGPLASMVLTAGLRLLRLRPVWMLAAALRAGGVVLVGRR